MQELMLVSLHQMFFSKKTMVHAVTSSTLIKPVTRSILLLSSVRQLLVRPMIDLYWFMIVVHSIYFLIFENSL